MKTKILNEVKSRRQINSEKKFKSGSDVIPDERNRLTCLSCPLKKCKPHCGRIKGDKE